MIIRETVKIKKVEEIEKIKIACCDFCGKSFNKTEISFNGWGHLGISFGYGSGFDDEYFNLDICDKCFVKKFGNMLIEQLKEKGFDIERMKKDYPFLIDTASIAEEAKR